MSKYLVGLLLGVAVVSLPFFASAQASQPVTAEILQRLQAQINELQLMVQKLTQQLAESRPVGISAPLSTEQIAKEKLGLVTALQLGSKDKEKLGEVFKLQVFLKEKGYFPKEVLPTGYYGEVTRNAVRGFQLERGIVPALPSLKSLRADELEKIKVESPRCFQEELATDGEPVMKCLEDEKGAGYVGPKTRAVLEKSVPVAGLIPAGPQQGITPPIPAGPGPCKGDVNRDGVVNSFDINPFRRVWNAYQPQTTETVTTTTSMLFWFVDIDDNGVLNQADIDGFVGILIGVNKPICQYLL